MGARPVSPRTPMPIPAFPAPRRRGMALVLVMVVLAALLVVATPFAVSMMFHEKTTRASVDQEHAAYGAEAARNYAVAVLASGHPAAEADRSAVAPWNTPASDGLNEVSVGLDDPLLRKALTVDSPRGTLLGLTVQDEQGKLNLRTAPAALAARVRALVGGRFANPRDLFTTHSGRDAEWITPARVRSMALSVKGAKDTQTSDLLVDDASWFGAGTRVRVSNGTQVVFGSVVENSGTLVTLDAVLPDSFKLENAVMEAMARHPVNVNTAPREVLFALFDGLAWSEDDPKKEPEKVTQKASEFILEQMLAKPLTGMGDFLTILGSAREKDLVNGKMVRTILLNALNPNHRKLMGTGTMPICFRSYDVYGIEAVGVRNSGAANQVARHAFYEVVETAPRGTLLWSLASQRDFDDHLPYECGWTIRAKVRANLNGVGGLTSPFGNGVVTWPNPTFAGQEADTGVGADDGDVRLHAASDMRVKQADHFPQFHEGTLLGGRQGLAYALTDSLGAVVPPPRIPSGTVIPVGGATMPVLPVGWSIPPGGVEMWAQPESVAGTVYFLDLAFKDLENHLWVRYDPGQLSVGCRDGGLEGNSAEVRAQATLRKGEWRHVSASWRTSRHGQMGLMLDGRPVGTFGYYDRNGQRLDGTLAGAINNADTTIACSGTFAPKGAVQIGPEIVEYDGVSGGLQNCVRGARGTTPLPHPAGTVVHPLGYSNPLANVTIALPAPLNLAWDRIPVVRGRLSRDLGVATSAELFNPANPRPGGGIQAADPFIPVRSPSGAADATADFPEQGYLLVVGNAGGGTPVAELVFYDSKVPNAFVVQNGRGQTILDMATTAQAFQNGAQVHLFSLEVDDHAGYTANNGVALIQVDDEWWVGRPFTDTRGGRYWTGLRIPIGQNQAAWIAYGDRPLGPANLGIGIPGRAIFETLTAAHTASTPVLPVFAVQYGLQIRNEDGNPGPPGEYGTVNVRYDFGLVGKNDTVTIVASDHVTKELATVRNGRAVRLGGVPANLVALDKVTSREYISDAGGAARLLKFPSGELVSHATGSVLIGEGSPVSARGGQRMQGRLDELKFFTGSLSSSVLAADAAAGARTVAVLEIADANFTDFSQNGGAVVIGSELIGYANARTTSETVVPNPADPQQSLALRLIELQECTRGYLGTQAAAHRLLDAIHKHPGMAVIALDKAVGTTDSDFTVKNDRNGNSGAGSIPPVNGIPADGYVLIDDELIGTVNAQPGRLTMPRRGESDEGIYRGAFGTRAASHGRDTLVYALPFRYHDRHRDLAWDDSMSHYTITRRATGATWKRVTWTADVPDRRLGVKVLVRIDGAPAWDAEPTNRAGGLYQFTDEKAPNALEVVGDQIELRFVFTFGKDSFVFNDLNEAAWKKTPRLQSVRVEYEQPTVTRYYETR